MNYRRPTQKEYSPYYEGYINQISGDNFLEALKNGLNSTVQFFEELPAEKWDYKYAPEKWSIKEVLVHILDAERVFAYRAMRVARNDMTPLPGFDENEYVPNSYAENRTPESIIEEFKALRISTIHLFQYFNTEQLGRVGTASNHPVSPLALGFITAGHEIHHIKIIKERYLD